MLTILLLTLFDPHADAEIVWNKAGTWGAYTISEQDGVTQSGIENSRSLYITDKAGARKRIYTARYEDGSWSKTLSGEFVFPVIYGWAPDDRHLLFYKAHYESASYDSNGSPLFDVNPHSGRIRKLTMPFRMENGYDDDRIAYDRAIAFSPDGRKLLLVMGNGKWVTSNKRIALLDYRTLERKWLTGQETVANSPSWSSNGQRIVYSACPSESTEKPSGTMEGSIEQDMARYELRRIWIMNADGTGKRQLTRKSDSYPIWRSKNVIEFIRDETQVWSMRPDGSAQKYVRELGDGSNFWRYGVKD